MIEKLTVAVRQAQQAAMQAANAADAPLDMEALDRVAVCAVLEALRDPTPEMVQAGGIDCGTCDEPRYLVEDDARQAWQAMIDAILNERKG